ncbi:GGDEF domain-containing protein [Streptomyces sp. MNP-20]|uniref:GGDEF domain-containing protein n=1 Tax=Streptomyces sp. MNP-20 TaxID=2721165 RepID=UPI001555C77D|nr:GGDEF domain-containing protein [Streptomyces sp. MNP-20]
MTPHPRVPARPSRAGTRTLLLATAALPLTGWALHALALHRKLARTHRDPLTGLWRREAYTARARRLVARCGDDVAVVLIDVDGFKAVNDQFGHAAGDTVLAELGARLTAWAGPGAAAGRLGGDEFAVVLELPVTQGPQRLAQLMRTLRAPVVLDGGHLLGIAASVGAATPPSIGSRELAVLQRAADAALYEGKHSGRAILAAPRHARVASINGRRAGRPGTAGRARAA